MVGLGGVSAVQGSSLGSSLSVVGPDVITQAARLHDGRSHDDRERSELRTHESLTGNSDKHTHTHTRRGGLWWERGTW